MLLLVDDEPDILSVLSEILEMHGYTVMTCSSAQTALEIFVSHKHNISTVITDFLMPKINGVELIRLLQEEKPNIRAILCSGTLPNHVHGNVTLIHKPVNIEALIESIESP